MREKEKGREREMEGEDRESDFRLRMTPKFSPEELNHELSFVSASLKSEHSVRTRECRFVGTQMQGFTYEVECSLLCPKSKILCSTPSFPSPVL